MIKLKNILSEQTKLTPVQVANIKRFNKLSTNEQKVVATLISEAGGELNAKVAMTAVYNVLSNRINEPAMKFAKCPNTLVGQATCPSQFSVWNKNNLDSLLRKYKVKEHNQLGNAIDIVQQSPADITGGATNYWASSGNQAISPPSWSRKMIKTKKIGNHQFAYLPDKYTKVNITIQDIKNGKKICYMQKTSGSNSAMHIIQTKLGITSVDGKFGSGTAKKVADLLNKTYTSYDGLCIGPNTLKSIGIN
jgi:hypothetical protein